VETIQKCYILKVTKAKGSYNLDLGPSDSGLVKEGSFAFINGRISSTKNRPNVTPSPLQRQYVIETVSY